ncbi:MAG: NUDIX hydrolase [Proteobacteria bacterium]|nr:NUDIX hydrolase [Pseudomonadota bacterium]
MTTTPIVPVPSATIIIGRDTSDGFEVFMIVRHGQASFAAGALVFPGGKVMEDDSSLEIRDYCEGAAELTDAEIGVRVAAIRETYEECGILLARPGGGDQGMVSGNRLLSLKSYRNQLNDEAITMLDFLKAEDLVLALDGLVPFAHWITPEMAPKRYDTYFFLARAPSDHIGRHDGSESVDSVWITPKETMLEYEAGKRSIMFPTRMNIMKLGRSGTLDEALSAAESAKVVTVTPWIEQREEGPFLCIPEEAGYEVREESISATMVKQTGGS